MTAENESARVEYRLRRLENELKALQEVVRRLDSGPQATGADSGDGRPWTCLAHKPIQHRDRKPAWCHECGRTAEGLMVGVGRGAAPVMGLCGLNHGWGPCTQPAGHGENVDSCLPTCPIGCCS